MGKSVWLQKSKHCPDDSKFVVIELIKLHDQMVYFLCFKPYEPKLAF